MNEITERYVHVLLFECPNCSAALAKAKLGPARNLEEVDGDPIACRCECGWSGTFWGVTARQHWVEEWHSRNPSGADEN